MSEWNDFIGNLAVCFTITLYLSGSQICAKIYQKGLVGDISALPFLTAFFNTFLAFVYGVLVSNSKIMVVNTIGFTLETCYLLFYLFYTTHKKVLLHKILFVVSSISVVSFYVFILEDMSKSAFYFVGYLGSLVAIVMFGSPLGSISNVIKTRSTESLSFTLCFANFATASLWTIYGSMLDDYFIMLPNLIGSILGFAQLALFTKFPDKSAVTRMKLKNQDSIL